MSKHEWSDPDITRVVELYPHAIPAVQIDSKPNFVYGTDCDYKQVAVVLDKNDIVEIADMLGMKCIDKPFDGSSKEGT